MQYNLDARLTDLNNQAAACYVEMLANPSRINPPQQLQAIREQIGALLPELTTVSLEQTFQLGAITDNIEKIDLLARDRIRNIKV